MLLVMLPELFFLIYEGLMLPICSCVIKIGSVTNIHLLALLTVLSMVPWKIYLLWFFHTQYSIYLGTGLYYLIFGCTAAS